MFQGNDFEVVTDGEDSYCRQVSSSRVVVWAEITSDGRLKGSPFYKKEESLLFVCFRGCVDLTSSLEIEVYGKYTNGETLTQRMKDAKLLVLEMFVKTCKEVLSNAH